MELTAAKFIEKLQTYRSDEELKKYHRYFTFDENDESADDRFMGVRMGQVFALAKDYIGMVPIEIEKLLESPIHEIRVGGCSIMNQQARSKKTTEAQRKELYDLYMRRHDRINTWDLVDLACIYVVGRYLSDKPRDQLYTLAKSKDMWERRTAIVSTAYFMKHGDVADTFKIATILLHDKEDLINKATGWMLRVTGDIDRPQLQRFLDAHAATMPRITLRNALEKFDKDQRTHYLNLDKA